MNAASAGRGAPLIQGELDARSATPEPPGVAVRAHRSGRWLVVEVEGEMDLQVVPLVPDLVGSDASLVVFELRGVTFMDVSGLGAIAQAQRRAVAAGGCVRLAAPSRQARRMLMLAGSSLAFLTFDTVETAVSTPLEPHGELGA